MKTRDVLRQEIRYQRSLLNADQQAEQSLLLSKRLIKEKVVNGVKHIAIYLANDGELMSYKHHGFWKCMDSLNDKHKLNEMLESGNAKWKSWD